jgi:diketogulonate reductase-like aldo/keto reductase
MKKIPQIGIGTFQMKDENKLEKIIENGIKFGYTLIDT